MISKRCARKERAKDKRAQQILIAAGAVGLAALLAAVAVAAFSGGDSSEAIGPFPVEASAPAALTATAALEATSEVAPAVEVPQVTGKTVAEARVILKAAGLAVEVVEDAALGQGGSGEERSVSRQDPVAGSLASSGAVVRLTVPRGESAAAATSYVVCIDPGHQAQSDTRPEPIGPGASETKERVRGGTTGVETGMPEYEVTLQISTNLKERLEKSGVKVVMTRTVNDVNVSNAERAEVANKANADLFVRVHGDGSLDAKTSGITTLYPVAAGWTKAVSGNSKRAAGAVQASLIAATGAASRGVLARDDLSGFNWSKVPVILVECGFMTNPVEDKLLVSPHYQDKLAQGMADGILDYLEE